MPYIGDTIATIRARLRNWLIYSSATSEIATLDLDFLNRAKAWLESYKWQIDPLITVYSLTLDSSYQVDCPSDLKTIVDVYSDVTINGIPDIHFYEDHIDPQQRYTKIYTHDNETGGYWTLTFNSLSTFLSSLKLKYAKFLEDYTGSGTEYSFFPGELLLKTAQKLFAEEKGLTGDNVDLLMKSHIEVLRNYETSIQGNNQVCDLTPKDNYGNPLRISGYKLDGSGGSTGKHPLTPAQSAGLWGF